MHLAKRKIGSCCARRKPSCQCLLPCQAAKSAAQRLQGMVLASARGSSLKACTAASAGRSGIKLLEKQKASEPRRRLGPWRVVATDAKFMFGMSWHERQENMLYIMAYPVAKCEMAFTLEHVAIACGAFGVIAGIVSFGFLGIVLWFAHESGGSAAVNRLPPLALSALLSSGAMIGQRRALRREDDLWGSFLTGFLMPAAPAAVVTVLGFVKCFFDICRKEPSGKKRA
eukprot:s2332_g13.t1